MPKDTGKMERKPEKKKRMTDEEQGEDVLAYIGKFPEAERHCAFLAVETLHEATNAYLVRMAGQ